MKKRVLVFDTETTWLPNKKLPLSAQPYIVQFAGIVVEMDERWKYKELARIDQLIKPPMPIPHNTSEIHWIYDIDVINKWPLSEYAKNISYFLNEPDFIVAHNLKFDEGIMRTEYERLRQEWLPYDFLPKNKICTMESSRDWCNLPAKSKFAKRPKNPKLQELTKATLWTYFDWAHNALVDVEWTLKAFAKLVEKWVVRLEEWEDSLTLF